MRIDDDLMRELKARAHDEDISLTRMLNRVIRQGLAEPGKRASRPRFRETTQRMGEARVDLAKALSTAADLEDEETTRKLSLRK